MQKVICLPLRPRRAVTFAITKMQKNICLPLMPRLAVTFVITKMRRNICLSLRPRQARHFLWRQKGRKKRLPSVGKTTRRMCSAQPQPSRSKRCRTRRRSNNCNVLPRYARPLGIRRKLCVRLAVKVPTQVLHRLTEKQ